MENENLKTTNSNLIEKNKIFYGRTKNQKRTILRLKKLIFELRQSKKETISDDWDCLDESDNL
jgi:hypothetical protein